MNKKGLFGVLVLVLVLAVSLAGCKTIDTIEGGIRNVHGIFDHINVVPAKNFQTLGLVFAENTFEMDDNGARGDVLTYQMLLKEAHKLEADTIVNVVIDFKAEGSQQFLGRRALGRIKGKVTWYGSATAIKFTDTLKMTTSEVILNDEGNPSVSNTSETYVRNSGSGSGFFQRTRNR